MIDQIQHEINKALSDKQHYKCKKQSQKNKSKSKTGHVSKKNNTHDILFGFLEESDRKKNHSHIKHKSKSPNKSSKKHHKKHQNKQNENNNHIRCKKDKNDKNDTNNKNNGINVKGGSDNHIKLDRCGNIYNINYYNDSKKKHRDTVDKASCDYDYDHDTDHDIDHDADHDADHTDDTINSDDLGSAIPDQICKRLKRIENKIEHILSKKTYIEHNT